MRAKEGKRSHGQLMMRRKNRGLPPIHLGRQVIDHGPATKGIMVHPGSKAMHSEHPNPGKRRITGPRNRLGCLQVTKGLESRALASLILSQWV